MANDWFYLSGEEQVGPYPGEQLHELIASGHIQRETHIWTEGMPEWLPAQQIENLFPQQEVLPAQTPVAAAVQPQMAMPSVIQPAQADQTLQEQPYPFVSVTKASFMKYLSFSLIIPLVTIGLYAGCMAMVPEEGFNYDNTKYDGLIFGGTALLGLSAISSIIGSIMAFILIHRGWRILQPSGEARTTPGAAVGFLFIPFFNLYWIFVTYYGFANDWNRIMPKYSDTRHAPQMMSGLFLGYCICNLVFWPIAPILLYIVISEFCKGINFMAARAMKASSPTSTGGGLQLY